MEAFARSYVYCPSMYKQLDDLAHNCTNCHLAAKPPRKSELLSWPVQDSHWSRLQITFAGTIDVKLLVDTYSKWSEIFPMSHINSEETFTKLRRIFNRFRVQDTLISENGSDFTSAKFSDFCQRNGIKKTDT